MPREDRRIIFTFEELYKALYALSTQRELRRPLPGVISSIARDGEEEGKFVVTISNFQENTKSENKYSRDFLAAALMLYCRSLNIPIAKMARKSVEVKDDSVILRLVI